MPGLRELQAAFRAALLDGDEQAVAAAVHDDDLGAGARLAVYRHHVLTSLTAALESTYPVIARLVDLRFFRYAASHYIRRHPPTGPCLAEYGATFGDFLAAFEPTRHLGYLPDVARVEWAMTRALNAPDAEPVPLDALRPEAPVALHPSATLLKSPWPIDAIWRANQPGADEEVVDLDAGAACLQVWRAGDEVVFRRLSPPAFAFRETVARTGRLDEAAEAALEADAAADLTALIRNLVDEQILVQ
jgi:hypothetical protein